MSPRAACGPAASRRASLPRHLIGVSTVVVLGALAGFTSPVQASFPLPFAERFAASDSAAADSAVRRYFGDLSDSTTRFFGRTAAPLDTTGLDSAIAYRLVHPTPVPRPRKLTFYPDLDFQRVDGPVYTGVVAYGDVRQTLGRVSLNASWASGPNEALGTVSWTRGFGPSGSMWRVELGGGRWTSSFDRESSSRRLRALRAFIAGKDHHSYYRREGWRASLHREFSFGDAGVTFREDDQTALTTTAGWNLLHQPLSEFENLPATEGMVREVEVIGSLALDPMPARIDVLHQTSGHAIGSDLEYRRWRGILAGSMAVSRWATLIPQALYGRLSQQPIPQAMFYLGGTHTLRSMSSGSRGGTGIIMGRMELIGAGDVLAALRIPHPSFLPLQMGAFSAVGAVWGVDPFGGPTRPGTDLPNAEDYVAEVGISAIYQPGFPDATTLLRVNYAFPLGPKRETQHLSISFMRALDLLRH